MEKTIKEALQGASLTLKKAGIANYNRESALLLAFCLEKDLAYLYTYPEKLLSPSRERSYGDLVRKRASGVPYHYLVGEKEFMGLTFLVNPSVLIPRPETEIMAEEALRWGKTRGNRPLNLLDLGTGSGVLAITLALNLPQVRAWALDISPRALEMARGNARRHGVSSRVTFLQGDLWQPLKENRQLKGIKFSLILSNPPYVPREELAGLSREVRDQEPLQALDGGPGGLDFYTPIMEKAPFFMARPGLLLLEVGKGQGGQVREIARRLGVFKKIYTLEDYQGIERVVASLLE